MKAKKKAPAVQNQRWPASASESLPTRRPWGSPHLEGFVDVRYLRVHGICAWIRELSPRCRPGTSVDLLRHRIRVEEKITEHGRLIHGEPKTRQSRRAVTIPKFVAQAIAEHVRRYPGGPERLVFTGPKGGPVRRPAFGRLVWRPAVARVGLDGFQFKNLRHTGASLAIAAGANPLLVAHRLGHTSTRMVEKHYVSLFEGLDREIGEKLGTMRRRRRTESKRLRPEGLSQHTAGPLRDRDGTKVVRLAPNRAEKLA